MESAEYRTRAEMSTRRRSRLSLDPPSDTTSLRSAQEWHHGEHRLPVGAVGIPRPSARPRLGRGRLRGVHDDCRAVLIRTDRRYGSQSRRSARRACRPRVNTWSTDPTALGGSHTGRHLRGTRPIPGISGQGCTQRYSARRPFNPMVVGSSPTRPMCRTACESLSPASASVPSPARRKARGQSVGHRARRGR